MKGVFYGMCSVKASRLLCADLSWYTLVCGKALILPLLLYSRYQIWVRFCIRLLNITKGSECEINACDPALNLTWNGRLAGPNHM